MAYKIIASQSPFAAPANSSARPPRSSSRTTPTSSTQRSAPNATGISTRRNATPSAPCRRPASRPDRLKSGHRQRRVRGRAAGRRRLDRPVSCADRPYEETRAAGLCDLGQTCVMDRRARRIDRFFAANPVHVERHLAHRYPRYARWRRAMPRRLADGAATRRRAGRARDGRRCDCRGADRAFDEGSRGRVRIAIAQRLAGERSRAC